MNNPYRDEWVRITGGGSHMEFIEWAFQMLRAYREPRGILFGTPDSDEERADFLATLRSMLSWGYL